MLSFLQDVTTLQWLTIAMVFAFGMELALLGSIKLPLAQKLQIDEEQVAGMLTTLNLSLIPMMLLSGVVLDFWSVRGVVLAGSFITALAVLMLAWAPNYRQSLLAMLIAGLAGASLSVAGTKLMPAVFFPDSPAAATNLGNVFFGLGALVTPLVVALLLRWPGYRGAVSVLAVAFIVPALAAFFTTSEEWQTVQIKAERLGDLAAVVQSYGFWLVSAALFLYVPLEFAVATWATTFLLERRIHERACELCLSGFWLLLMLSRLLSSFLLNRLDPSAEVICVFVIVLAAATALVLAAMTNTNERRQSALCLLVAGATLGPVFPSLVGILFMHLGEQRQLHGSAYGAAFSIGLLGGAIIPPIIGRRARKRGLVRALAILIFLSLALAGVVLALAFVV